MAYQICEKHPEEGEAGVYGYPCQSCEREEEELRAYLRMLTHGWRNPPSVYVGDIDPTHPVHGSLHRLDAE